MACKLIKIKNAQNFFLSDICIIFAIESKAQYWKEARIVVPRVATNSEPCFLPAVNEKVA